MMKTRSFYLAVLAMGLASPAIAQIQGNNQYNAPAAAGNAVHSNSNYNNLNQNLNVATGNHGLPNRQPVSVARIVAPNTVDVNINGLMNIVAEEYLAVFNIVQVGEDITETDELMNARIRQFKHKLQGVGIDSSKVKVDMISFVPRYAIQVENKLFSKTNQEVPAGFELQKNVMVHFKNSGKIDDIVTAAAQAEIYDLVKVDYFVKDLERSYDSLMNACVAEAKERVKMYEGLGFRLDTVRKAVLGNFTTVFPMQRYYAYQAFSRPSLPATRKGNPVKLNEAEKTTSRYYNAVEVDGYDVVINPVITEPVVQLSYSLNVQYYLSETKPSPPAKNNYYILLESGELKQIFPGK